MSVELRPHQIKASKEMHNGCVLTGGVGSGKTRTVLTYYFFKECGGRVPINGRGDHGPMRSPKDIVVITTKKKKVELDWEGEAAPFGIFRDREHSVGGVSITVDTWQNIEKYKDVKDAFVVFDEQRLVGAGAWVKAFLKIAENNTWVLLSATPADVWMDFVPLFLAHGFYRNRTEFIRQHVVYSNFSKFPKVDRYVEVKHLERLRDSIIVEMPVDRHTKRHLETVLVKHNEELFNRALKDRWHVYEQRPLRDVGELFVVMRKIVNSDLSRLGEVMRLLEKHPKLIVFYNFNYELETLRTLSTTLDLEVREWNGHKHEAVPTGDKWVYLVQYTAGSEGWNCITTDAECFYSLTYSWKVFEQSQGRIDRLNTPFVDLWYYIFRSGAAIDTAIAKKLATKQSFNEKRSSFATKFEQQTPAPPTELELEYMNVQVAA